jgi:hypothetical protein
MTGDIVEIIRAIVRDELKSVALGDIAVVTSVFPHTREGDENNYECSVKLRESDLELRRVPMATPHVGMVSTPNVGDLVLLTYVGGDGNRPIVIGRLYSDDSNPPLHEESEWRMEAPYQGETSIAIDKEESVVISAGKTLVTLKKDGCIEISGKEDLKIKVDGNVELSCSDCKIDATGDIELGTRGDPVITEGSHRCYFTGEALVGSNSVKAKG